MLLLGAVALAVAVAVVFAFAVAVAVIRPYPLCLYASLLKGDKHVIRCHRAFEGGIGRCLAAFVFLVYVNHFWSCEPYQFGPYFRVV